MQSNFYVIGIGGSAGSSPAVIELLKYLPGNMPASFIIIQHVHRTAINYLESLATKITTMKVVVAEDAMLITPGCVYVPPADKSMTINGDYLYLMDRPVEEVINESIDLLFNSLALLQQRAIGIILSGMGTDGVRGLHEIYSNGGISIVQQPDTAPYSSMPQSAIRSYSAQFTLTIKQIADLIIEILKPVKVVTER